MLWDADKVPDRYFDDPINFRSQLAKYDALIFRMFPAQYFERFIWECEALEIMIEDEMGAILLSYYLELKVGYSFELDGPFEKVRCYALIVAPVSLANSFGRADLDCQEKIRQ